MVFFKAAIVWCLLLLALIVPVFVAVQSPLLAWRDTVYIIAGFAGVLGLGLMLVQPLLASAVLPGLVPRRARRIHLWVGGVLIVLIAVHVAGLWVTSPPDMVDALLLRSPTAFSFWGVLAMWSLIGAACVALLRHRLRPRVWRLGHTGLVILVVAGSVGHAMLIEGTMGVLSKSLLCAFVIGATVKGIVNRRVWHVFRH